MVLKTKEENRTNAQYKPLRLRVELVHLFPLVVQKLSSLIITKFTKYKSNSLSKYLISNISNLNTMSNPPPYFSLLSKPVKYLNLTPYFLSLHLITPSKESNQI